jgi:hypothetical protein
MRMAQPDFEEAQRRFKEIFPTRESHLGGQITTLSRTGQPCDVTFYQRPPILDVVIDQKINLALMYGAGAKKLQEMLNAIHFSDGSVAGFGEIWTINPMPEDGIPEEELNAVDLASAEEPSGPQGETLRKMISETYHCKSRAEEDRFLRRFIAS